MQNTVKRFLTRKQIQTAFESIFPELRSRIAVLAKRFHDPDEAMGEMLAFAWSNFQSVARRRGVFLHPGLLAWVSAVRHRSGRCLAGSSITDVHSPLAHANNRSRLIHLSALSCSAQDQVLSDSTVRHITHALTTGERERPDVRAATRIDWAAFARQLPTRMRRILHWLTVGASKTWIAKKLGISNGRVSQLLDTLGCEIKAFFGLDIVPAGCIA